MTIAQVLDIKEASRTASNGLRAYLRNRHMLLVLDNFEQLIESGPLLAELLAAGRALLLEQAIEEALHSSATLRST